MSSDNDKKYNYQKSAEFLIEDAKTKALKAEMHKLAEIVCGDFSSVGGGPIEKILEPYYEGKSNVNINKDIEKLLELEKTPAFWPSDSEFLKAWELFKEKRQEIIETKAEQKEIVDPVYKELKELAEELGKLDKRNLGSSEKNLVNNFIENIQKPEPNLQNSIDKMNDFIEKGEKLDKEQKKPLFGKIISAIKHYSQFVGYLMMGRKELAQKSLENGKQAIFNIKNMKNNDRMKSFVSKVEAGRDKGAIGQEVTTKM